MLGRCWFAAVTRVRRRLSVADEAESMLLEREIAPLLAPGVHLSAERRDAMKKAALAEFDASQRDRRAGEPR